MYAILIMIEAWPPLLLADLHERTGLQIKRCEVDNIDFLRDTAEVKIYYDDLQPSHNTVNWLEAERDKYFVPELMKQESSEQ